MLDLSSSQCNKSKKGIKKQRKKAGRRGERNSILTGKKEVKLSFTTVEEVKLSYKIVENSLKSNQKTIRRDK